MTTTVILVGRKTVLWQYTHQHIARDGGGRFLQTGNLKSHGTMDAKRPCGCRGIKQHRDVAVSYQPFGMLPIIVYGYLVQ